MGLDGPEKEICSTGNDLDLESHENKAYWAYQLFCFCPYPKESTENGAWTYHVPTYQKSLPHFDLH